MLYCFRTPLLETVSWFYMSETVKRQAPLIMSSNSLKEIAGQRLSTIGYLRLFRLKMTSAQRPLISKQLPSNCTPYILSFDTMNAPKYTAHVICGPLLSIKTWIPPPFNVRCIDVIILIGQDGVTTEAERAGALGWRFMIFMSDRPAISPRCKDVLLAWRTRVVVLIHF